MCDVGLDWSFRFFFYGQIAEAKILEASGSLNLGCERTETISAYLPGSRVGPAHYITFGINFVLFLIFNGLLDGCF